MTDLITTLSKCYCHFVRCIKPNENKNPNEWNASLALKQIRYMGLLDSLKVRKESYPFRFEYSKFYSVYQDMDQGPSANTRYTVLKQNNSDFKQLAKELLDTSNVQYSEKQVLFGTAKIFLNEKFKNQFDKLLFEKQKAKKAAMVVMQS